MENLKFFISLSMLIAVSFLISSASPNFGGVWTGAENFTLENARESIVVGQIKDGNPAITRKPALQKALNNHYKDQRKVIELKISIVDNDAFLVATTKEKNGSTFEIAFELERKGLNLQATRAASETCSGCSHCAFAVGGGCVCLAESGDCNHSTTRDSLVDILETQNF